MKYFSDFLIKKGTVKPQDIVEAFLKQITSMPAIPQVIYDRKLLTEEQILIAFNTQHEEQIDFLSACKKNGFWSLSQQELLDKVYNEVREPMGHYLVQKGKVDLKTLVKALDEFLSQASQPPKVDNPTSVTVVAAPPQGIVTIPHPSTSQNALAFNINPISSSAALELSTYFTDVKINEMENIIQLVSQNISVKEVAHEFLQDLLKGLQSLKGLARFGKAEVMDHICNSMITLLSGFMRVPALKNQDSGKNFSESLKSGLILLKEIRNSIATQGHEGAFWNQADQRNKVDHWTSVVLKTLNEFQGMAS